jgi:hypothetical protein
MTEIGELIGMRDSVVMYNYDYRGFVYEKKDNIMHYCKYEKVAQHTRGIMMRQNESYTRERL